MHPSCMLYLLLIVSSLLAPQKHGDQMHELAKQNALMKEQLTRQGATLHSLAPWQAAGDYNEVTAARTP